MSDCAPSKPPELARSVAARLTAKIERELGQIAAGPTEINRGYWAYNSDVFRWCVAINEDGHQRYYGCSTAMVNCLKGKLTRWKNRGHGEWEIIVEHVRRRRGCPTCERISAALAESSFAPATLLEGVERALTKINEAEGYLLLGKIASGKNMLGDGKAILEKVVERWPTSSGRFRLLPDERRNVSVGGVRRLKPEIKMNSSAE